MAKHRKTRQNKATAALQTLASEMAAIRAELDAARQREAAQTAQVAKGNGFQAGPRVMYQRVPSPVPQGGDTIQTVWKATEKGPVTFKDLQEKTGLSEGQIKGALRSIQIAGFLTTTAAH